MGHAKTIKSRLDNANFVGGKHTTCELNLCSRAATAAGYVISISRSVSLG